MRTGIVFAATSQNHSGRNQNQEERFHAWNLPQIVKNPKVNYRFETTQNHRPHSIRNALRDFLSRFQWRNLIAEARWWTALRVRVPQAHWQPVLRVRVSQAHWQPALRVRVSRAHWQPALRTRMPPARWWPALSALCPCLLACCNPSKAPCTPIQIPLLMITFSSYLVNFF
jgi:hypothetical protein